MTRPARLLHPALPRRALAALLAAALAVAAGLRPGPAAAAGAAQTVRHPPIVGAVDRRAEYPLAALRLALEKAGVDAALVPAPVPMEQERAIRALASGQLIDVLWTVTSPERERRLRAVRVPFDRGLIGWRVLMVRRADVPRFAAVRDAGDLARLRGAQGHDWPDLAILRANGLDVIGTPSYASLFELLVRGRIDYVPRGVGEAIPEIGVHATRGLALEPRLVLHYPSAMYFFVHPDNAALAESIERGLRASFADGSLDRLLLQTYGEDLARLALARRERIGLANPLLPAATPLSMPGWWYQPGPAAGPTP